jgi:sterol 3beta-glucosyltransferase
LDPNRLAVWWSTEYVSFTPRSRLGTTLIAMRNKCLKLSAFAAQALADAKLLDMNTLDLHRALVLDISLSFN